MTDTEANLAEIDPIVRGLLPGYIDRRRAELAALTGLLAERRYADLEVIGHNLSGSGGAYGLPGLGEIGRLIEEAAAREDQEGLAAQIDSLGVFLNRVVKELE